MLERALALVGLAFLALNAAHAQVAVPHLEGAGWVRIKPNTFLSPNRCSTIAFASLPNGTERDFESSVRQVARQNGLSPGPAYKDQGLLVMRAPSMSRSTNYYGIITGGRLEVYISQGNTLQCAGDMEDAESALRMAVGQRPDPNLNSPQYCSAIDRECRKTCAAQSSFNPIGVCTSMCDARLSACLGG